MKYYKYIFLSLLICVAGLFTACSDWLDYSPKDKETEEQTFGTRQGFYTAVNGVYNRLISDVMYGKNLTWGMLDILALHYQTPASLVYEGFSASELANYNYSNTNVADLMESIWDEAYATILNINVILDNAETRRGTVLSDEDYNLIRGDMLALRAFLHFDMLRMFGPVYSRDPEQLCIPYADSREAKVYEQLSARSIIYDHLLPDLEAAEICLHEYDPIITQGPLSTTEEGADNYARYRQLRLNYYATILLKARVYLWAGDRAAALVEARKLTDDPQVRTYFPAVDSDELLSGSNSTPDRTFSTEILFGFYDSGRDNIYTSYFESSLTTSSLLTPRSNFVQESLFGTTSLYDYRARSQWTMSGELAYLIKYKGLELTATQLEDGTYPFWTYFMPLMHLSEAYYIAAECLQETDPDAALEYMNGILATRGRQQLASGSNLLTEIQKEYMRETWGEGQAFFFFKRLYMNITRDFNGNSTSSKTASDNNFVIPLPESELINR